MEKRLRRKFVLVAMSAVTVVLALIMCTVNVLNYVNVVRSADSRLELIAQNGGSFPGAEQEDGQGADPGALNGAGDDDAQDEADVQPEIQGDAQADAQADAQSDSQTETPPELPADAQATAQTADAPADDEPMHAASIEPPTATSEKEAPFETRYFAVELSADGGVIETDVSHIAATSQTEAQSYAKTLLEQGKTQGFYGVYRYLAVDGDTDGSTLYVFVDCSRDLTSFRSFLAVSAGISVAGLLLVLLLVMIFSRIAVRPIVEAYDKQKRFITDASHEIKTPLAVIGAANDVQEIESGESEWTRSIAAQVTRLSALTERLVFLARMDEGTSNFAKSEVDFSELVERTSEPFVSVAESRGRHLSRKIASGVRVHGDAAALSQVVELLLDNATRYASDGSVIELAMCVERGSVRLVLTNAVDELPAGDLDRLFERFYRADTSRNSETGGSGVGLSVARAIVEAHGGTINAAAIDPHTIAFTVTL